MVSLPGAGFVNNRYRYGMAHFIHALTANLTLRQPK